MIIGELYEKIFEKCESTCWCGGEYDPETPEGKAHPFKTCKTKRYPTKKEIEEALDEAKAEYHLGMPIILLDPEKLTPEKVQESFTLLSKVILEKDQWFKKWFGK